MTIGPKLAEKFFCRFAVRGVRLFFRREIAKRFSPLTPDLRPKSVAYLHDALQASGIVLCNPTIPVCLLSGRGPEVALSVVAWVLVSVIHLWHVISCHPFPNHTMRQSGASVEAKSNVSVRTTLAAANWLSCKSGVGRLLLAFAGKMMERSRAPTQHAGIGGILETFAQISLIWQSLGSHRILLIRSVVRGAMTPGRVGRLVIIITHSIFRNGIAGIVADVQAGALP